MKKEQNHKTCLIISYGPVPTPEYQTVEGGGMRAWGLAQGLRDSGVDVTVSVNSGFPQTIAKHDDILLANWSLDDVFKHHINDYDSVIVSYCMGDVSEFVAKHVSLDTQLILDVYVPIYVEVSARESENIDEEYSGYMRELDRYNKVLKRGDYFLCANDAQKTFYTGVLSSLGVLNPRSYREQRILIVPFGIEDKSQEASENPYVKLGIGKNDFVVLWFGGLYPWFRVEELLGAMKSLKSKKNIKFVIVGSKNPFNPNPDFFKQHDKAYAFSENEGLLGDTVHFVEWVDFDKRINYYKGADIVISLNQPGDENQFSWRTRVMDYIWGDMVIVSNGGDPLSDELITAGAAIKLPELSSAAIVAIISKVHKDRKLLAATHSKLAKLKEKYYWSNVTSHVAKAIEQSGVVMPYKNEHEFSQRLLADTKGLQGRLKKPAKILIKAKQYVRQHGMRNTVKYSAQLVGSIGRNVASRSGRRFVFISHPIDNTGAPLVLMQVVEEFADRFGVKNVKLVAPNINYTNQQRLRGFGLRVEKAAGGYSDKVLRFQLDLKPNDYVLMNTIAVHDNYRTYIFNCLQNSTLKEAHWFIHEDEAQFSVIAKQLLEPHNLKLIRKLAQSGKLHIYVPSKRTQDSVNRLFKIKSVKVVPLRLDIDKKYHLNRKPAEYSKINFLLSGSPADGRKGQLIALAAFEKYLTSYVQKDPGKYRDFNLHLLSIGDDYISQQIRWIGDSALGDKLKVYASMPYRKALELTSRCNAVICCSINETFALYVAEGMYMGHVVLRNNSAGMDEQLRDGENGYYIDHKDIDQFAKVIEKMLNTEKTSDTELLKMGQISQEIIEPYISNSYIDKLL